MQMSWISPTFQWCGEFLSSAAFFPLQMSIGGKRYKQDHFLGHNYVWSLTECLPRWWRLTRPTSPGWTPSYGARSCARTRSSSNWWARTRSSWGPGKYPSLIGCTYDETDFWLARERQDIELTAQRETIQVGDLVKFLKSVFSLKHTFFLCIF